MDLFSKTSFKTSHVVTKMYSTSFYMSARLLKKQQRDAIFAIYGFVRFADEIVDTFHEHDKELLLNRFEADLKEALERKISLNPVLHAFQQTIHQYNIPYELIAAFLKSMRMDINKKTYTNQHETDEYIHGSANVVGLMCLKVFTNDDEDSYNKLKMPAMKLGSAFQKVNFLRDLQADISLLHRVYFCGYDFENFDENAKQKLVNEINDEFTEAKKGIVELPGRSKLAVLTAFYYYQSLLKKIAGTPSCDIMEMRVRISNQKKMILLIKAMFVYKLRLI